MNFDLWSDRLQLTGFPKANNLSILQQCDIQQLIATKRNLFKIIGYSNEYIYHIVCSVIFKKQQQLIKERLSGSRGSHFS